MNRLAKYGLLTVLVAVIATALVRLIALSVIAVPAGFWPLRWETVIGSTVFTTVGATIVYGGLTRFSKRPNRTFTIIAGVVLVLSFGSFVAPPAVPASVIAALAAMHVIVAVASVGILTRAASNAESSKNINSTST